jgi:hypothetical protein
LRAQDKGVLDTIPFESCKSQYIQNIINIDESSTLVYGAFNFNENDLTSIKYFYCNLGSDMTIDGFDPLTTNELKTQVKSKPMVINQVNYKLILFLLVNKAKIEWSKSTTPVVLDHRAIILKAPTYSARCSVNITGVHTNCVVNCVLRTNLYSNRRIYISIYCVNKICYTKCFGKRRLVFAKTGITKALQALLIPSFDNFYQYFHFDCAEDFINSTFYEELITQVHVFSSFVSNNL